MTTRLDGYPISKFEVSDDHEKGGLQDYTDELTGTLRYAENQTFTQVATPAGGYEVPGVKFPTLDASIRPSVGAATASWEALIANPSGMRYFNIEVDVTSNKGVNYEGVGFIEVVGVEQDTAGNTTRADLRFRKATIANWTVSNVTT